MSQKIAQTIVDHLSDYQKKFQSAIPEIELCFDGGIRPLAADPDRIRVLAAGPHNKADNLILDRFRFHAFLEHPCLVITNDEEIQDKIEHEGGRYLNVFDFVLLPHQINPVFLPSEQLHFNQPGLSTLSKQKRQPANKEISLKDTIRQFGRLKPARKTLAHAKSISIPIPRTISTPEEVLYIPPTDNPDQTIKMGQIPAKYYLTLSSWPVNAGIRFLLASFCSIHRPQFINLLESFDLSQLRSEDLIVLADYLRTTCSVEPDFTHRGSLMDRVRLALLKAGDTGLDLAALAAETDIKPEGLGGRIKRKANGWLCIKTPNNSGK